MQYFKLALPLALASSAFANPLLRRDVCASNACLAAVTGKAALGDDGLRADHCKSYLATTVTPEAITETTTITGIEPETSAWGVWKREKVTVCPNEVPNYASACETAAYSSACSCFGYSGDSTKTLKRTTTTKTVYVPATGACSAGSTKTVTVTLPSGVSAGVSTKTITVTIPSGFGTATFSGVFTSTVYETSSVCPTPPGLGSTTKSTSTVTTTSAVTTTVTTTASGSTCPTTSATTSTVTVSGTTSTVTVSGTTSVITTTASASTCPTTTATTSTVTVSGTTSTVTVSGTTSIITTTASASTCPTTTATTSTVTLSGTTSTVTTTSTTTASASSCPTTSGTTTSTVTESGTTSTVTTTESASSCPTTSATTTVTTTETTTTTSTTTSSYAAETTCLSQDQVDSFVSAFTDFLENTAPGAANGLSGPFNTALAVQTFTEDFQDYSDSINYMAGFPLGGVTFNSRDAFIYGQGQLQYPVYGVQTQQTFVGCNFFTWHWTLNTFLGQNRVISGINVFEVTDDLSQIKTNYAEFNNGAWLQNIKEALAAQAATTTTTTSDVATSTTTDATTTTTTSASGGDRRRY